MWGDVIALLLQRELIENIGDEYNRSGRTNPEPLPIHRSAARAANPAILSARKIL
jgi:hypothetical protein